MEISDEPCAEYRHTKYDKSILPILVELRKWGIDYSLTDVAPDAEAEELLEAKASIL